MRTGHYVHITNFREAGMSDRLISSVHIQGLFGLYDYKLPKEGELDDAAILYGDNGVGKSTVLRLAFHLLSAGNNKGHRTALYRAEFSQLEVVLTSGIKLSALRNGDVLILSIIKNHEIIALWEHDPNESESSVRYEVVGKEVRRVTTNKKQVDLKWYGEKVYLKALANCTPNLFLLNAERYLHSDSIPDATDEVEFRKIMHFEERPKINDLVARTREIGLAQAMNSTFRWIADKALQGANQGSTNVHAVYGQVLQHLMAPTNNREEMGKVDVDSLSRQLSLIEIKTSLLANYDLAIPLPMAGFKKALTNNAASRPELAASLLKPYIESIEGRLEAVEPIYQLVHRFVETINQFLSDKKIEFKVGTGFKLKNRKGVELDPTQLSSGEQQLLLLFCYVLTARDTSTVFMIDEPEISLNIKWQRQLVQSLLDITEGAKIQFIFASHSLELLSQHRNRVIKLDNYHE